MLGLAFGGGVLLGAMIPGNHTKDATGSRERHALQEIRGSEFERQRAQGTWDTIKGALIGVGIDQVRRLLDDLVPGFRDQYGRTEAEKRGRGVNEAQRLAA